MDRHINLVAVALVVLSVLVRGDDLECHLGVTRCMEPIKNYSESMKDGRFVPYMSVQEFNIFCKKYGEVDSCIKQVTCSEMFVRTYMGVDQAMEFMCEEQPEGYPRYARCVTHPVISTEMEECAKIVHEMATPACGLYNRYLACGYTALENHCSADEAAWFEEILVKSSQPQLEFYDCQIERPSKKKSKAGIIAGVAIAVLVIIVLAAGVALFLYNKRKHVAKGYKPATPGIV